MAGDLQREPKDLFNIGVTEKQIILTQKKEDFLKKMLIYLPTVWSIMLNDLCSMAASKIFGNWEVTKYGDTMN